MVSIYQPSNAEKEKTPCPPGRSWRKTRPTWISLKAYKPVSATVLVDLRAVHVRVAGIDAPEKGQPFGQLSKQGLSKCAYDNQVEVEWRKKDRYGRTVGKVMVGQVDCGLRQIEQGLAWHYKAYAKEQAQGDRVSYVHAEEAAREARAGLWSEAAPIAPWEYRHQRRATVEAQ